MLCRSCRSGEEQYYIETALAINANYYLGIEAQGPGNWMLLDGTFIGNNTPSVSPYRHWRVPGPGSRLHSAPGGPRAG